MDSARTPLISVIVPVYNVEEWVGECLASISAQTFSDFECIVVDDGSTDGSPRLVDEFAETDGRFRVVHQANRGLSGARNAGIELARGEYLLFVDSDDYIHPQMIEKLVTVAQRDGARITMCDFFIVDGESITPNGLLGGYGDHIDEHGFWLGCFSQGTPYMVVVWNKLFLKSVFDTVRFREGTVYEDLISLSETIPGNCPIPLVHESLYYYRKRAGSITYNPMSLPYRLVVCEEFLARDDYFKQTGWNDVRVEHLRAVCKYLELVYQGIDDSSSEDRARYAALRKRTIRWFWELLPHVLVRPRLAARIIPYVIDERFRSVLESALNRIRRR